MDELSGTNIKKGIGMSLLTLAGIFFVVLGLMVGWISLIGIALLALSLYLARGDTSRFAKMNVALKVLFIILGAVFVVQAFL